MDIPVRTERVIEADDWNALVEDVYGRPYCLQWQGGCWRSGPFRFSVPGEAEDFTRDSISNSIKGDKSGVSFKAWKSRHPKASVGGRFDDWYVRLFWHMRFFPEFQTLANDLYRLGKIDSGSYTIDMGD